MPEQQQRRSARKVDEQRRADRDPGQHRRQDPPELAEIRLPPLPSAGVGHRGNVERGDERHHKGQRKEVRERGNGDERRAESRRTENGVRGNDDERDGGQDVPRRIR